MATIKNDYIVFMDDKYVLGMKNGYPFIKINDEKYLLTSNPYEPCLYISKESHNITVIHNSFESLYILDTFFNGQKITSITGQEYDARAFCRMVEYALCSSDIQIDEAEKVFKCCDENDKIKSNNQKLNIKNNEHVYSDLQLNLNNIIEDDSFNKIINEYPDCVVDYCLIQRDNTYTGYAAHKFALNLACQKLFIDEDDEIIWDYDINKANGEIISSTESLFYLDEKDIRLENQITDGSYRPYWQAFLLPPSGCSYTLNDFKKVNETLFPNGTKDLEIYSWSTNWSDYFDDGHEWWGTLCLTIYDKSLDRFVVILASATD